MLDVIIIGAGPGGMCSAYHARRYGLAYVVLEKGEIAESWRNMPGGMAMLSPGCEARDLTSIAPEFPIWEMENTRPFQTRGEFIEYLEAFARRFSLKILQNTGVVDIEKMRGVFRVYHDEGFYEAKSVISAMGVFCNAFYPDVPGIRNNPRVSHSCQYRDRRDFKGKRVVIIGAGNSAIETALDIAGDSHVILISKDPLRYFTKTGRLNHIRGVSEGLIKEMIGFGIVECIEGRSVSRVNENIVILDDGAEIVADRIMFATGFLPAIPPMMGATVRMNGNGYPRTNKLCESTSVRNLFFAGASIHTGDYRDALIHGFREKCEPAIHEIHRRLKK